MGSENDSLFIAPLTTLRFFAAMMVVGTHFWGLPGGYAGVGFFFVLSGYVMALNYANRVANAAERVDFWFRRFARIFPTYLLTYLVMLPIGWPLFDVIPSLLLLQSWFPFPGIYDVPNAPAWSLSTEAFFYAVFPFILGLRARTLVIWIALLVAAATAWTWHFPDWTMFSVERWWGIEAKPTIYAFYNLPPVRLIEFAIGIWLAGRPRRPVRAEFEFLAIAFAVVSIAALPYWRPAFQCAIFFMPAAATLVFVFARSHGMIARLLSNKILVLLGDASFMLYMIHWPIAHYLGKSVATASLAIVLSVILFHWFEKPAQRWLLGQYQRIDPMARGERARA